VIRWKVIEPELVRSVRRLTTAVRRTRDRRGLTRPNVGPAWCLVLSTSPRRWFTPFGSTVLSGDSLGHRQARGARRTVGTAGSRTLETLLPAVDAACSEQKLVVALTSWQPVHDVALLPFLLHTSWADRARELALNATFALVPFTPAAQRLTMEPLIDPELAVVARYVARVDRNEQGRSKPLDFVHPDWEEGYQRHKRAIPSHALPARAYVPIDRVRSEGAVDPGFRPVLGRFATRGTRDIPAFRPQVLIAPRTPTRAASAVLTKVDVLVADAQGLRGPRMLEQLHQVLAARGSNRAGVLVASSPSDLAALCLDSALPSLPALVIGPVPAAPTTQIRDVERHRPQEEERFRFSVLDMKGSDPDVDRVIPFAVAAWWSTHQRLGGPLTEDPAYRRLLSALDDLRRVDPQGAAAFVPLLSMLEEVAADATRVASRTEALMASVDDYLSERRLASVTVVLRDAGSCAVFAQHAANAWAVDLADLQPLGLTVTTSRGARGNETEGLVVNGYYGAASIDDLIRSGARFATLVFDPLESLAFHRGLHAMLAAVPTSPELARPLRDLLEVAQSHLPLRSVRSVPVELSLYTDNLGDPGATRLPNAPILPGTVVVFFADGTNESVPRGRRFDVLPSVGTTVTSVPAEDLQPGQEVILTDAEAYSPVLLAALDEGVLLEHAQKRAAWLQLVKAAVATGRISVAALQARLRERGVFVDDQTVRAWVRGGKTSGSVPRRWAHFVALSHAIGLELEPQLLREFFTSVRVLRVRHR